LLLLTLLGYATGVVPACLPARGEGGQRSRLRSRRAGGVQRRGCQRHRLLTGAATAHESVQILPELIPYLRFSIRLDPLGLFFTLLVSLVGLAIAVYSLATTGNSSDARTLACSGRFSIRCCWRPTLVFLADNAFFFLIAWEIMALSAYFLVSFEHEKRSRRNAGVLFFVMSHIGTGCLILGFLLLFQTSGGYGLKASMRSEPRWRRVRAMRHSSSSSSASA